ncbi:carboxyltransferase domain-containing protein [Kineobactrum salinum]|uniref:carboxyltransferase domain-containing protein n=1 Tax=Kineobactrum salinum TaxID=2708301 RepID=UPI0022B292FF|nr:carboxyltransferase domain-containing protein [Kineobactrum salinum]
MQLRHAGENALILYLGERSGPETAARVQAATLAVRQALDGDLVDLVPSYASLLVIYDPMRTDHMRVTRCLHRIEADLGQLDSDHGGGMSACPFTTARNRAPILNGWHSRPACQWKT